MICKTVTGKGFRGCVNYVYDKVLEGKGEIIASNDITIDDKKYAIREMIDQASTYEDSRSTGKFVWHTSIAFPKNEMVNDELMKNVAMDYIEKMNLDKSQYMVVKHLDTEHRHFHIVANRINSESKLVSDSYTKNRDYTFSREMEAKYNLEKMEIKQSALNTDSYKNKADKQKIDIRNDVKESIASATSKEEFIAQLKGKNIEVTERGKEFKFKKTDIESGKSYDYRGTTIDKNYSKENINSLLNENAAELAHQNKNEITK
jgi:hypothetical protein